MFRRISAMFCLLALCACGGSDDTRYVEIEVVKEVQAENSPPIANAGESAAGLTGETFYLSAITSQDPDGDILAYQWTLDQRPAGSTAYLDNIYAPETTFVPDIPGEYLISLTVHDGRTHSAPVYTTIICEGPQPVLFATDPAGTIFLYDLEAIENFRNATNVNFGWQYTLKNTDTERVNFGVFVYGVDAEGDAVFAREIQAALDPGESRQTTLSFGEPLTTQEYDSITSWEADPIAIYDN